MIFSTSHLAPVNRRPVALVMSVVMGAGMPARDMPLVAREHRLSSMPKTLPFTSLACISLAILKLEERDSCTMSVFSSSVRRFS